MGQWIQQLKTFYHELEETFLSQESGLFFPDNNFISNTMTECEIQRLVSKFGDIPEALLDFFRSESSCLSYTYAISKPYIYGGPMMSAFRRSEFFDDRHLHSPREFGQFCGALPPYSDRTDLAFNCVAINHELSGDALVIDVREGDDPPVFRFMYDAEVNAPLDPPIASSFSEFLAAWARLCYIEPSLFADFDLLDHDGRLNASDANVLRLREQLGLKNTP